MATPGFQFAWNGDAVGKELRRALGRGVQRAANELRNAIVRRLSVSNRGVGGLRASPAKGAPPPMRKIPSKPGEPPRGDTGKLRQSIFHSYSAGELAATVGTTLKYGVYQEKGTRPHTIAATRKKVLCFGWHSRPLGTAGGSAMENPRFRMAKRGKASVVWDWRFFKRVHHPGQAARPYLWSTLFGMRDQVANTIVSETRGQIAASTVQFREG